MNHPARAGSLFVWLLIASLALALPLMGQTGEADAELRKLRREIDGLRTRLQGIESQRSTAAQELEAIDLRVEIAQRELEILTQARSTLEADRHSLTGRVTGLESQRSQLREQLGDRLAALYRLGSLGYLRMILSISADANPFEAISMLSYLVTRDNREIQRLELVEHQLAQQRLELERQRAALERVDRDARVRAAELETARQRQRVLVTRLEREAERSSSRLVELEEKARRLENLLELLFSRASGEVAGADIRQYRGVLPWPVTGPVISAYGRQRSDRFATYTMNNGIRIGTAENAPVRAIFPGTVIFSRWFRGYGNLVIVDHGNRVFSLYGNTRMSTVRQGEKVAAGQVIATAADGEAEELAPHVYFEIRDDNRPVDPTAWIR